MQAATIIDRAWVQSWLTSAARQDRATYRLTTHRKELEVVLPPEPPPVRPWCWSMGSALECQAMADDRLVVPLAAQRDPHRCVIELQYNFTDARDAAAVRIEVRAWDRTFGAAHVLAISPARQRARDGQPGRFYRRVHLGLGRLFRGRQPVLDEAQLEAWLGTPAARLPDRDDLYLFSTLGDVPAAEIQTASRTWIVLWASGAVLVVGLVLIYLPATRHPGRTAGGGPGPLGRRADRPRTGLPVGPGRQPLFGTTLLTGLLARGMSGSVAAPRHARKHRTRGWKSVPRHAATPTGDERPGLDREHTGPAASPGECRAMRIRVVLPPLLAMALLAALAGAVAAAEEEAARDCPLPRIFVPAERLSDWPTGSEKYLPLDAAEFERLAAAVPSHGTAASSLPAAAITSARYEPNWWATTRPARRDARRRQLAGPPPALSPLEPYMWPWDR